MLGGETTWSVIVCQVGTGIMLNPAVDVEGVNELKELKSQQEDGHQLRGPHSVDVLHYHSVVGLVHEGRGA